MNERYRGDKDFISKDALLNYEGSGLYSSRDGKAAGMNVTTLVAFAEYYNVSTDYILGLREEKTPDASIQGVSFPNAAGPSAFCILITDAKSLNSIT